MNLKSKLEQELAKNIDKSGQVEINPDVIRKAIGDTEESNKQKKPANNIDETTSVKLSDRVKNDPMLVASEQGSVSEVATKELVKATDSIKKQTKLLKDTLTTEKSKEIEITSEDKYLFLDTIIENSRFTRSFNLFGGKLQGTLRTRTQNETRAIFQQLNKELRDGKLETQLEYSLRLRNMLFAAQVEFLNGDMYAELQKPLMATVNGEETTEIGWLHQVDIWNELNDGLTNLLFNELCRFEYKYLTLLEQADDQNFWKTELPT